MRENFFEKEQKSTASISTQTDITSVSQIKKKLREMKERKKDIKLMQADPSRIQLKVSADEVSYQYTHLMK